MSTFYIQSPKYCNRFCLAHRICSIAENNIEKLRNLEKLKSNLSKYHYLDSLIKQGFQKALSILKKDLYENVKNPQIKTSCYSLQHLIQITLIIIALLNPGLILG